MNLESMPRGSVTVNDSEAVRVLVVSYAFPPTGGAGVQRVAKLVKYLPAHGVSPTVLTVANPSVPTHDLSLLREVEAAASIVKVRSLEPGYRIKLALWRASAARAVSSSELDSPVSAFSLRVTDWVMQASKQLCFPDPQILWQPGAQFALVKRLLAGEHDDVVFISGPPFSQFLLAPVIRAAQKSAVVLDYRDEWSSWRANHEMAPDGRSRSLAEHLERALLRRSHFVTTATDGFRGELLRRFRFLDPGRVIAIPNGYDRSDFPVDLPEPPSHKFVATYAGTVFRLTSASHLLRAVRRLHERSPGLARSLELRFIGRIVQTELAAFAGMERFGVRRLGYMDHDQMLRELSQSHLALCILDQLLGAERVYPGKIFELMALGRPCLTLAPPGALSELVERHGMGEAVGPRDEAAIAEALARRLQDFKAGRYALRSPVRGIERYERRRLAGEFAEVFRAAERENRAAPTSSSLPRPLAVTR